ncbi:cation:proton antiporter [bacterium]|nr:cation:proton antiporter [bacterium]
MHLAPLIRDLAVILGIAAITTYVFRKIRQPVVLGYLAAGLLIGPYTPPTPWVSDLPNIKIWADLGVIFVMLSLGLDFSFHKLARVGGTATITALGQVLLMLVLGYGAGHLLGWSTSDCFFLGGILAISSTTIIYKALGEQKLRSHQFAEQVFGILIVEDLVAVLLLVALSVITITQTLWDISLLIATLRLILVVGGWFLVGYFLIPTFLKRIGRSLDDEALTVWTTGLCLMMVAAATKLGYSEALGAFVIGSILSETQEARRIEPLMRPLRDLFAAVFFVSVGMLVDPRVLVSQPGTILFITAIVIIGKILGVTVCSILSGQPLRSSVRAGFSLAQIGEFSFIIAGLGTQLGVTSPLLYPIAVAVSGITTFTTPYLIRFSDPAAQWLESRLPEKWRAGLNRYSNWMRSGAQSGGQPGKKALSRFLLNGILVSAIFVLVARWGMDFIQGFTGEGWALPLGWAVALLLSAPFVWGMFFAYQLDPKRTQSGFGAFLAHLGTVLLVGSLSGAFFLSTVGSIGTLVAALALFLLSYRRLEGSYRWFEGRLLDNLKAGAEAEGHPPQLAPWDLHLVEVPVHPNSALAGQTLSQAQIRQKFGLNIVAVYRGDVLVPAPSATTPLFPMDRLLIIGTDAQIALFRSEAEHPRVGEEGGLQHDYSLERLFVDEGSPFAGKTIRESGIREQRNALIVGLENRAFRTTNPDPSRVLVAGDTLWVVTNLSSGGTK